MKFTKNIYSKNVLLGMLDIAMDCMIEHSLCDYCSNNVQTNPLYCNDVDLCKSALFEGILDKFYCGSDDYAINRGAKTDNKVC